MTEAPRGLVRLAIETSGTLGSVAVAVGADVLARSDLEGTTHARNVVPAIDELLADAGVERLELDGVEHFLSKRINLAELQRRQRKRYHLLK